MNTRCVVVIGHVDHGKTALVRALTGTDTDRLPEEKARGLSITPGFAHRTYSEGVIDFVDAPGHADFIQGMVSGASGAQAALVVISLADGICAQTREHLNIAGLLGLSQAVIALSKCDLVTPADQAARVSEIQGALARTPFAAAAMVKCCAPRGEGVDDVHLALQRLLQAPPTRPNPQHSFLPIDRAFTLPGRGTIVTGTLLGPDLSLGTDMTLHPAGRTVSLRGLQSRGAERDTIHSGERMAANLRRVTADDIPRGSVLCAAQTQVPSAVMDTHLTLLSAQSKPLKHLQDVRVLFGTTSVVAQLRLFKDQAGARPFAQLRFPKPMVCFAGQRTILRRLSPAETLGGAVILDPQAKPTRSRDTARVEVLRSAHQQDPTAIASALIKAHHGCAELADIARLARLTADQTRDALGGAVIALNPAQISSAHHVQSAHTAVLEAIAAYHQTFPLHAMAPRTVLDPLRIAPLLLHHVEERAVADKQLRSTANKLALHDHDPMTLLTPAQRRAMAGLEDQFRDAGLTTPLCEDQNETLIQLLISTGTLIPLANVALKQTLTFHRDTLRKAAQTLAAAFPDPQTFTTSEARSALNTSRRIIVPVLEHFDSLGMTIRNKDIRQIRDENLVSPLPPA